MLYPAAILVTYADNELLWVRTALPPAARISFCGVSSELVVVFETTPGAEVYYPTLLVDAPPPPGYCVLTF